MNSYASLTVQSLRALDYTSYKSESQDTRVDQPVLDLSCKKPPVTPNFSPVHHDTSSNSPSSHYNSSNEEQSQTTNLSPNLDRKVSLFEPSRTFMVTPPSEEESQPKRARYDMPYHQINVPTLQHLINKPYDVPINVALPVLSSALQPLIVNHNNNHIDNGSQAQMSAKATSTTQDLPPLSTHSDSNKSAPRPFKAYPKDPLSLNVVPEMMYDQNSDAAYCEFRKKMLDSVRSCEGTNIKMRRISKSESKSPGLPTSTFDDKDSAYWERRRKNNEAAKRSRDARRAKEDEIAIRAAFLEQENLKLKYELVALRNETAKLRCMIYSN